MAPAFPTKGVLAFILLAIAGPLAAQPSSGSRSASPAASDPDDYAVDCSSPVTGSPYVPVDSWVYPAVLRLYSLGYVDTVYLGMRPWTRESVSHMLDEAGPIIDDARSDPDPTVDGAQGIYDALVRELHYSNENSCLLRDGNTHLESSYSATRVISGTPLRDSFHLGSTAINDYGRPYSNGVNNYSGVSAYASAGRFLLYVRGEFQGAPSAVGYSTALAQALSANVDLIPANPASGLPYHLATIPMGPITTTTDGRLVEAYASVHLLDHEISFGKQDDWLGPGIGGAMAYSDNAENIYSFRINRMEPLNIPLLSRITGPFRYEFLVGKLRGHTYVPNPAYTANPSADVPNVIDPGDPWVHVEKFSFKPVPDLEFGFERTVIWGEKGTSPSRCAHF